MASSLPRITARIDAETQNLLSEAAAISGISSINSFVLNAAIEKAKLIIKQEQSIALSQADTALLLDAIERPAVPNKKLKAAISRYENETQ